MSISKTFAGSPFVMVHDDGELRVDTRPTHGPGCVNVGVRDAKGFNVLSLNLSAGKAKELQRALGVLLGAIPPSWADAQVLVVS